MQGIYKISIDSRIDSLNTLSEKNKELILEFVDNCFICGLGEHRVLKYISTLKSIAYDIQIDFDKVGILELKRYVSGLERSDKSEWTKHDYKIAIRKFYKWYYNEDNPTLTKWIKTAITRKKQKAPEDILTQAEIITLIDNATNNRDKALIALLWDIGARIGEIGTLRIKDLIFDDIGLTIHVNGKTGFRRVRAVWSIEYLNIWLNEHPERDNPNAPLWFKFGTEELEILRYDAIRRRLIKISEKAGIKKKIHPHLFRHSRATYMANYLTEAQMNQYFGWIQGSDMPFIYVHLSGRDIDDAVLKANGMQNITSHEEINESTLNKMIKDNLKSLLINAKWG
jgi:integrase